MRSPYTQLYIHLVWATWDRVPILTPERQETVYQSFRAECEALDTELIAVGGMPDHVHLLVRIPTTISIAKLVKQVKGASSRLVSRKNACRFKWQGAYSAFTVSRRAVPNVRQYLANQERHHREHTFYPAFEAPPTAKG